METIPPIFHSQLHRFNGLPNPFTRAQSSQCRVVEGAMDEHRDNSTPPPRSFVDGDFDVLEWHVAYQSCQRYFLDHAQYETGTQAVCALINIRLPCQWLINPVIAATPQRHSSPGAAGGPNFNAFGRGLSNSNYSSRSMDNSEPAITFVSPIPYLRRLIVTGFDRPAILHGFFGDDWQKGVMPHVECERRNYLFAAKHGGWRSCKKQYDEGSGGGGDETVPFMKPLDEVNQEELTAAEKAWSNWLAMEDWMVGPRAPEQDGSALSTRTVRQSGVAMRNGGLPDGH